MRMRGSVPLTTRWHKYVGLSQNCRPLRRESTALTRTHRDTLTYSERVQDPLTDVTTQLIIKMWEWEWRLPLWSRLIRVVCLITHWIQDSSHLHADPTQCRITINSGCTQDCENWPLADNRRDLGNLKCLFASRNTLSGIRNVMAMVSHYTFLSCFWFKLAYESEGGGHLWANYIMPKLDYFNWHWSCMKEANIHIK